MVALYKKLQIGSFCPYQSQQFLPLYKYKNPEFLSGLLGPKTFLLSFLDKLLLRQG